MPPARCQMCDYPGCRGGPPDDNVIPTPYITEEGLPKREEVAQDLKEHLRRAHELPLQAAQQEVEKLKAEADKLRSEAEKLRAERPAGEQVQVQGQGQGSREVVNKRATIPRPEVEEGINESDWSFFSAQWTRYKTSTKLTGQAETQHLWVACSQALQRSLHNGGAGAIMDPVVLMERVKELAVKKHK